MIPIEINKKIAEIKGLKMEEAPNLSQSALVFIGADNHASESYKDWAKDIEDAWELFEEMSSSVNLDYDLCLHKVYDNWCVSRKYLRDLIKLSESKTAPEAICLAWKKWKER